MTWSYPLPIKTGKSDGSILPLSIRWRAPIQNEAIINTSSLTSAAGFNSPNPQCSQVFCLVPIHVLWRIYFGKTTPILLWFTLELSFHSLQGKITPQRGRQLTVFLLGSRQLPILKNNNNKIGLFQSIQMIRNS